MLLDLGSCADSVVLIAYKFPKALERLEELKKSGKSRAAPVNGKLARKDQKRDEAECAVM